MPGDMSTSELGITINRSPELGIPPEKAPFAGIKKPYERLGGLLRKTPEKPGAKSFMELKHELEKMQNEGIVPTDSQNEIEAKQKKEDELSGKINTLYQQAKKVGVFNDVKTEINRIEGRIGDKALQNIEYNEAVLEIGRIDTQEIETKTKAKLGNDWKDEYTGMIGEYNLAAGLAMDQAWLEAHSKYAKDPATAKDYAIRSRQKQAEVNLHKFGEIPKTPSRIAETELRRLSGNNVQPNPPAQPAAQNFTFEDDPNSPNYQFRFNTQPTRTTNPARTIMDLTPEEFLRLNIQSQREARREVEPSFEFTLEQFHKKERLCAGYDSDEMRQIKLRDRAKEDVQNSEVFDRELNMFHAALIKRTNPSMAQSRENSALSQIRDTDMTYLLKNQPGYYGAMRAIARNLRNRELIPGLDFSLADCQNEARFLKAAEAFDLIIAKQILRSSDENTQLQLAEIVAQISLLPNGEVDQDSIDKNISEGFSKLPRSDKRNPKVAAALTLANRAVNTAINTMFAFNVIEYYNNNWHGRVRDKYMENGGKGPIFYDRLVAKQINDTLHPLDDLINEGLKPQSDKPNKNNVTEWAETQMKNQGFLQKGIHGIKDFDQIRILEEANGDSWKLVKEKGKRVLLVPPVRPTKIYGSILDANEVNIIEADGTTREVTFMDALADGENIDLNNIGLKSNFCAVYASDAPHADNLKSVFRDEKELKDWNEINTSLGKMKLGDDLELRAWLYGDLADAIEINSRSPKLIKEVVRATEYDREFMGLPERRFDLISYITGLEKAYRTKY